MPKLAPKAVYVAIPARSVRIAQLFWLLLGGTAVVALVAFWGVMLLNNEVASHREYVGQLSPDTDPVIVHLPKGAILGNVLTSRNEEIISGQTLATLDVSAMQRSVEALSVELLHDDLLRNCLLNEEIPEGTPPNELEGTAWEQFTLALQTCKDILKDKSDIYAKLGKSIALLHEEQSLIERYVKVLASSTNLNLPPDQKQEDARQALALALLDHQLDQQILDMELVADQEAALWNDKRLAQLQTITEAIRVKTELRQLMLSNLEHPRLLAPQAGHVVRVRNVSSKDPQHENTAFIEMRPENGQGYRAHFDVPHHQLEGVDIGNQVRLTMLGMLEDSPVLVGEITDLDNHDTTIIRASITLDDGSVAKLDDPRIGVALRGRGTASIIHVKKQDFNTFALLGTQIRNTFAPSTKPWFIQQLLTKYRMWLTGENTEMVQAIARH